MSNPSALLHYAERALSQGRYAVADDLLDQFLAWVAAGNQPSEYQQELADHLEAHVKPRRGAPRAG
jgi:hypothetical protein